MDARSERLRATASDRSLCTIPLTFVQCGKNPCSLVHRYMSNIPLRTLRRSRNARSGYTPLRTERDGDDPNGNESVNGNNQHTMPPQATVTRAAAVVTNQRWKGKKKQNYQDDPEEYEGLLRGDEDPDGEEEEGVGRAGPAGVPIHEVCPALYAIRCCLTSRSDQILAGNMLAARKTSLELSRSDHQVCLESEAVYPSSQSTCFPLRKVSSPFRSKYRQKPEIQRLHILTHRFLRAVQVLLQLIFPACRSFAVYSRVEDRCVSFNIHPCRVTYPEVAL